VSITKETYFGESHQVIAYH